MPTLTYITGWEHGVLSLSGGGLVNDWANASISSTTVRNGGYALRLNPVAAVAYWEKAIEGTLPTILVARFYVRFATLPGVNIFIFNDDNASTNAGIGYNNASGKFCTMLNDIYGTGGGPTVVAGTWYRIDCKIDASTGTLTVDGQVDGSALTQSSGAFASATFNAYKIGPNATTSTMDLYADDLIVSHTAGDYPLGAGYVKRFSPNAVGTHNLEASPSSAFFRDEGGAETAIATGETASSQNLDDVPLNADEDHVLVENDASLTAAHYLEYGFTDSVESAEVHGVRALVALRQDTVANCDITARLREGGVDATIYTGDVNNNFRIYKGTTFATKPSGGAWTEATLNSTVLRYGYTIDADGRVRLDSSMVEVAFGASLAVAPTLRPTMPAMRW